MDGSSLSNMQVGNLLTTICDETLSSLPFVPSLSCCRCHDALKCSNHMTCVLYCNTLEFCVVKLAETASNSVILMLVSTVVQTGAIAEHI